MTRRLGQTEGDTQPAASSTGFRRGTRPVLELSPRPPFRLDLTAWALRRREQNRIDVWDGRCYRRTLVLDGDPVEVVVTQTGGSDAPQLEVTLEGAHPTAGKAAFARSALTRLLGLESDLAGFYAHAERDPLLRSLANRFRGVKPPRFPTQFECLLNAVACQQLSISAGLTLLNRLAAVATPAVRGVHAFPAPADVLGLAPGRIRALGFSERKVETILELAAAATAGELELEGLDDGAVITAVTRLRGLGPWSADYLLLRGLGRLHVFPRGDAGALNGLRRFLVAAGCDEDPRSAISRFAPHAGLVYFHLLLRGLDERGLLGGPPAS